MKFPFNPTLRAAGLALALLLSPAGARAADGEVFAGTLEGKQITELLQKRGLSAEQALKITATLSQVADTGSFGPADKYKLTLDRKGRFSSLVLESSGKTYSVRSEDGSLTAAAPRQETEAAALPKASAPAQAEKKPSWRATSDGGKIFTGALEGRPLAALLMEKGADRESAEKSVAALEISGVSAAAFGREAGFVLELGPEGSFRRVSVMDAGRLHTVIRDGNDFSARVSRPFSKPAQAQEQQAKTAATPAEAQQAKPASAKKPALREYAGTLKDERLADLLERKGVPAAEAARIATAMSAKTGTTQFGADDRYKLAVSDRGELSQLTLRRADDITYTVTPDNGAYKMTRSGAELKLKMDKPKPAPAPEAALVEIPQTPQAGLKPETLPAAPPASETLALSWGKTAAAPAQAATEKPEQKEVPSAQEKPAPKAEEKTKGKKKADEQTAAKGGEKKPQAEKPVEAPAPVQTAPAQTAAEPMPAVAAAVIAAPPAETTDTEEEEKPAYVSGTIGADSVYIVLKKHGFKEPVLTDATLKLGRIINQKKIWDKDEYRLQSGPSGEFVRFAVKHRGSVYSVEKTASGYAVAQASGWPAPRAPKESAKPAEAPITAAPEQETPVVAKAEEKPARTQEKAAPKTEIAPTKTETKAPQKEEPKAEPKAAPKLPVAAPKAEVKAAAKPKAEARANVPEAAVLPQPSVLAPAAATTPAPVNAMTQQVGTSSPYMILKKLGGYKEPLLSEVIDRMGAMLDQKKVWDEDICRLTLDEKGAFASFELSHAGTVYTVRKNSDGKFESGKEKGGLKPSAAPAPAQSPAKIEAKPVAPPQQPAPAVKAEEPRQPETGKPETAPKTEAKPAAVKTEAPASTPEPEIKTEPKPEVKAEPKAEQKMPAAAEKAPEAQKASSAPAAGKNLQTVRGSLNGKSLYIALRDKGVREPALSLISDSLEKVVNQKKLWDNDKYLLTRRDGEFVSVQLQHGATVYTVARAEGGKYEASLLRGKLGQAPEAQPEPKTPEAKPQAPKAESEAETPAQAKPAAIKTGKTPDAPKAEPKAETLKAAVKAEAKPAPQAQPKTLAGKLGSKPLYIIMRGHGLREPVLSSVTETMDKAINQKKLWAKDTYKLELDADGKFLCVTLRHRGADYSVRADGKTYRLEKDSRPFEEKQPEPKAEPKKPDPKPEVKPAAPKQAEKKPAPAKPEVKPAVKPAPKAAEKKPAPAPAKPEPKQDDKKNSARFANPLAGRVPPQAVPPSAQKPDPSAPEQWAVEKAPQAEEKTPPPQPAPSDRVRTGKLRGRPLHNVLKENAIREPALTRITTAIASLTDIRDFSSEDTFELVWERSGRVRYVLVNKGGKCYAAMGQPDGQFRARVFERKPRLVQRSASGDIRDSLWVSLEAAGVPAPLILDYAEIFSGEIDFLTEPQNGDTYALDWQREETAGGATLSRVNYAAYSGKTTGMKKAYYYSGHYFDENGHSLTRDFLRAPLTYRRISSHFSKKRLHPVLKVYRQHNGVDYAAPAGTPVSAVSDGVVTLAARNGGLGNCVEIKHAEGYVTAYGHLQKFASGIKRGKRVSQGDLIGFVGSTGLSTGPHLDFRIQRGGQYFDYLAARPKTSAIKLEGRQLAEFRQYALSLDKRYGVSMPMTAR